MNAEDVHDVVVMTGTCVLGAWLSEFIREAYILSERPIEVHQGDGDYVFPDLGRSSGDPRVMMMVGPGRKVNETVAAQATPTVATLDDPIDSVRYNIAVKSTTFLWSVREQTKNASGHHLYLDNPAVLLLQRRSKRTAHQVLADIIAHCRLRVRPEAEPALLARFGGPPEEAWSQERALASQPHYIPLSESGTAMTAEQMTIVRQVLSPMLAGALRREIGPITWGSKVFLHGDKPDEVAPQVVDVTGAARVIFYGPFFHLPPGIWAARIIVAFSSETRGTRFRLVLYTHEKPIAKAMIMPDEGGAFEGVFTVRHVEPERYIEVHFMNDEGTIEGHVGLGQITFTRLDPLHEIGHSVS